MYYKKGADIMAQSTISVRVDSEDKKRFEEFCSEMGMNISTAINMLVKNILRTGKMDIELSYDIPNAETVAAIEEVEEMKKHPEKYKGYTDVDEMMRDLLK